MTKEEYSKCLFFTPHCDFFFPNRLKTVKDPLVTDESISGVSSNNKLDGGLLSRISEEHRRWRGGGGSQHWNDSWKTAKTGTWQQQDGSSTAVLKSDWLKCMRATKKKAADKSSWQQGEMSMCGKSTHSNHTCQHQEIFVSILFYSREMSNVYFKVFIIIQRTST